MKDHIKTGIYLVVDPSRSLEEVLPGIEAALREGVNTLQVWDHFPEGINAVAYTRSIMELAGRFDVPVLVNGNEALLLETGAHGIHYDEPPVDLHAFRIKAGREFITGITCGNDVQRLEWANENGADYISFCSMFPSLSAGPCEIVNPASVLKAKKIFRGKIFLSGGITTANLQALGPLEMDGIAVISGILQAPDPGKAARDYVKSFNQINMKINEFGGREKN